MSDAWSFSLADPGPGLYCYASRGLAVIAADGRGADARLAGEGPFTAAVTGLGEFELEPLGPPVVFAQSERHEWICKLSGSTTGYASVSRGAGIGGRALRRSVWACVEGKLAVLGVSEAARPASPHGDETLEVHVARGVPLESGLVADPRLSTSFDAEGRVLRAGLELWEEESEEERERGGALRLAGERVVSAELGNVSVAFLTWHQSERAGTGCYAIEHAA